MAREHELDPARDVIFDSASLADRWGLHPKRAILRAKQLGVPKLKFNSRTCGFRLSDILRAEAQAVVVEPQEANVAK